MVQFQEPPGDEEEAVDGLADADIDETPAEDSDEQETVDDQPVDDPLSELRERLDAFETSALRRDELNPDQVRSVLGIIQSIQSDTDRLKNANPVAEIDPRLSASESVLATIAQVLINSDLLDDSGKAALQQSLSPLSEAQQARQRQQLRNELLAELRESQPQPQDQSQTLPEQQALIDAVRQEERELRGYAAGRGIDWASVPASELLFRQNETVEAAAQRVRGIIDRLASEESSADRVAERRAAAGRGAPQRSGAATTTEDILARLADVGLPMTNTAERKLAAKALGVELPS